MTGRQPATPGRVVAIIPARGGSVGVPGKNVATVGGLPLVARAVRAASSAALVDEVIVSTDDADIRTAAQGAGAVVLDRSEQLAGSTASSESVLLDVLDRLRPDDQPVAVVVMLQCTSPFLVAADVDAVVAPLLDGTADSAFTAARSHGFLWRPDGSGINHDPAHRPRRQERPVELLETGAAYAMTADGLREHRHRFFGRVLPVAVDAARTLEIDEPHDLARARALAPLFASDDGWPTRDRVQAAVFDFDGTLTDDRVLVDSDGREAVFAHRGDGLGIGALRRSGLPMLILSTERNPVVAARAGKLEVPALHGVQAKAPALARWCREVGVAPEHTIYVGNDVNDLPCFEVVGWPIAVADAHPSVRAQARLITSASGGHGAIREIASRLLGKEIRDGFESPPLHR